MWRKTKAIKCHENQITVSSTRSLEIYIKFVWEKPKPTFYGFSCINGQCCAFSIAKMKEKEVETKQNQMKKDNV